MNIKTLSHCLFLPLMLAACVDSDLDEPELGTELAEISNAPSTAVNRDSIQPEFMSGGSYKGPCTGLALSRHWVITAAHCVEQFPMGVRVAGALKLRATSSSDGTTYQIYGQSGGYADARFFRHPNWSGGGTDKNDDLALIRLYGSGIMDSTYSYRGNVYWDNREPWDVGSNEFRFFFVAGYGYGSPDGSSVNCPSNGQYVKRLGMFDLDPSIGYYNGNLVAKARTSYQSDICGGDSGAPYLLLRGGRYMSFAVHSGNSPTAENGGYEFGTLIRPKMAWIESTASAAGVPLVCSNAVAGGYTYRSCTE
jgi:hypothetical protein